MTVKELRDMCSFDTVVMPDPDREVKDAYMGDLLSWVMGRAEEGNAWITIMNNVNTIAVASLADVSCVILSEGVVLDDDLAKTADMKGVNVLTSGQPSFETALSIGKVIGYE